jgi:hypothetical protein
VNKLVKIPVNNSISARDSYWQRPTDMVLVSSNRGVSVKSHGYYNRKLLFFVIVLQNKSNSLLAIPMLTGLQFGMAQHFRVFPKSSG